LLFDLTTQKFSLANARLCAQASKDTYLPLGEFNREAIGAISQQKINSDTAHVTVSDLGNCTLVTWRGTKEPIDWLTDLNALYENIKGCSIHKGIYDSVASVIEQVNAAVRDLGKPVVIDGHSLGGGQAMVNGYRSTWDIRAVYTFGQPRVGDPNFARLYDQTSKFPTFRVTNATDPVPWVPWLLGRYRHAGKEIFMPEPEFGFVAPDFLTAPSMVRKVFDDGLELWRLWRDIKSGNFAHLCQHPIERYIERLAA